jgi:hypothetical protein
MGRSMAHIAHRPVPVCVEGGVSRWLTGVVVIYGGGGAAPAPPLALLQFECLRKTRGAQDG